LLLFPVSNANTVTASGPAMGPTPSPRIRRPRSAHPGIAGLRPSPESLGATRQHV
jgi:hypothetical protein